MTETCSSCHVPARSIAAKECADEACPLKMACGGPVKSVPSIVGETREQQFIPIGYGLCVDQHGATYGVSDPAARAVMHAAEEDGKSPLAATDFLMMPTGLTSNGPKVGAFNGLRVQLGSGFEPFADYVGAVVNDEFYIRPVAPFPGCIPVMVSCGLKWTKVQAELRSGQLVGWTVLPDGRWFMDGIFSLQSSASEDHAQFYEQRWRPKSSPHIRCPRADRARDAGRSEFAPRKIEHEDRR